MRGSQHTVSVILPVLRLLIRTALVIAFLGLVTIGFCWSEPVKAARAYRQVRTWVNGLLPDEVQKTWPVTGYQPIVLSRRFPSEQGASEQPRDAHVRLLDLGYEPDFSPSLKKVTFYLDGQVRHAIAGTPPFHFSYRLNVPRDASLVLGVNHEATESFDGELHFEVSVSGTAGSRSVYSMRRSSKQRRWKDVTVDLGEFSGRDVSIDFETSVAAPGSSNAGASPKDVTAYWSTLLLRSEGEEAKRPNVFLILIDTLRPDHLGAYGYERATSPAIDELATKGVRFERAYSAASWTNPSILALFTGRYPADAWEPKPHEEAIKLVVPPHVDTMAEILAANGYLTVAASDHPGINAKLFGQGFDIYLHLYRVDGPWTEWRETDSEKVLRQLHDLLEGRPDERLFTYIHLIYPHGPYEPPPPWDDYFGRGTLFFKPKNRALMINMYDGDIRHTDEVIKDFLADIRASGLAEDSIVILLSDHGEGFWEHGLMEHGNSLYNELLHIPLVFYAPGRVPENVIVHDVVRITDVLPTVLDLVGIPYDADDFRGRSLLPLMRNGVDSPRLAFSECPHSRIVRGRAIQSSTEKLIDSGQDGQPPEYYDLMRDSRERHELHSSRSSEVSELAAAMDEITRAASQSRAGHVAVQEEPSADTIKKLRSLGYTE